jgi:hypothetical protein
MFSNITETFGRSWKLTKTTFRILKKEPGFFGFTILSLIATILIWLVVLAIAVLLQHYNVIPEDTALELGTEIVLLFIAYLSTAFVGGYLATGIIYLAGKRFQGEDPEFSEGFTFANMRLKNIFRWSMLQATIVTLLGIVENVARNILGKGGGLLVVKLSTSIIGLAWSISTMFALQSIAFENTGPWKSVKSSVNTLKETWGEVVSRSIGFAATQFLLFSAGVLGAVVLMFLFATLTGAPLTTAGVVVILFFFYVVILFMTFHIAVQIYNTALYIYAKTGNVPSEFDEELLQHAFTTEEEHRNNLDPLRGLRNLTTDRQQ